VRCMSCWFNSGVALRTRGVTSAEFEF